MTKAKRLSKLKKSCHELWSQVVRQRDGKCMVCGATDQLQAHHFIVSAARSLEQRYNPSNGICLCFAHHLRGVHTEASFQATSALVDAALTAGHLNWEDLRTILRCKSDASKVTEEQLQQTLAALQTQLAAMSPISEDSPPPKA